MVLTIMPSTAQSKNNCGTGAGGFQKGNTCQAEGSGRPASHAAKPKPKSAEVETVGGKPKREKATMRALAHGLHYPARAAAFLMHAEVHAYEWAANKLPAKYKNPLIRLKRLYFSTFKVAHRTAVETAKKAGVSPRHVKTLASILTVADLAGAHAVPGVAAALGWEAAALATAFVPIASLAYLTFSASKNPVEVMKTARESIKRTIHEIKDVNVHYSITNDAKIRLAHRLAEHDDDDWYVALICTALDAVKGKLERAIELADRAYASNAGEAQKYAENCGTGAGGFKKANVCAVGGKDKSIAPSVENKSSLIESAMLKINSQVNHGAMISIRELRKELGNPSWFDDELFRLAREDMLNLHRHDYPAGLSEQEKKEMLHENKDFFIGVSLRSQRAKYEEREEQERIGRRLNEITAPPVDSKIGRDAFLYMEPKQDINKDSFAQCSTCALWTSPDRNRCMILGPDFPVPGSATCGEYVPGESNPDGECVTLMTPEEVGFENREVRCENCRSFLPEESACNLYRTINRQMPDLFDLDEKVNAKGCCNANKIK